MKINPSKNLISKLNQIREELKVLANPESKAAFLKNIDDLIAELTHLRASLVNPVLVGKTEEVLKPIEQVISFLEFAKTDETLKTLLLPARKTATPRPKRQPIEIPKNLTNEQIRALLGKDLSKDELKAIASQREISVGQANSTEIKQNILKNLEKLEGYERLGIA